MIIESETISPPTAEARKGPLTAKKYAQMTPLPTNGRRAGGQGEVQTLPSFILVSLWNGQSYARS